MEAKSDRQNGSAWGPVILPVFKTGGRQVFLSPVGSTPTRFRHFVCNGLQYFVVNLTLRLRSPEQSAVMKT